MCLGSTPTLPPSPPPPQAAKAPDATPLKRRNAASDMGMAAPSGGTLLTGPSGVASSQMIIGQSSLLGGGTKA